MSKTVTSPRAQLGRVGQRRQVVIPREICETIQLRKGDLVAFNRQGNGVLIKPKKLVDPDDVLTAEEAALFKKAEEQLRRGDSVTLAELDRCAPKYPLPDGRGSVSNL
jgi:AbrB family looped-hinge helix DNA binding protein